VDVSDPTSPDIISTLSLPSFTADVTVVDHVAYVATPSYGLHMVDVSDPLSPSIIGNVLVQGTGDSVAIDVAVENGIAYLAAGDAGFVTIDVSDPTHPVVLDSATTELPAVDVVIEGSLAYVAAKESGTRIFDVTYPSSIKEIGFVPSYGRTLGIAVENGFVRAGDFYAGLHISDASACHACPADVNGDGVLNVLDFVTFQKLWQAEDPGTDCDGNGSIDEMDFACFQRVFAGGCN
jgi:hypothetical protein